MTGRRTVAIAGAACAAIVTVALATPVQAGTAPATTSVLHPEARERPRGVLEDCSTSSGWGRRDEFTRRQNLVVGPLAIRSGAVVWEYNAASGDKLFVHVRGGHRVALELSPETHRNAGLVFGRFSNPNVRLDDARRVVRFVACRRGERTGRFDGWPVTSWVGGLLIRSPRCVPLLIWVDDEPKPRRAVIRFGVPDCG